MGCEFDARLVPTGGLFTLGVCSCVCDVVKVEYLSMVHQLIKDTHMESQSQTLSVNRINL